MSDVADLQAKILRGIPMSDAMGYRITHLDATAITVEAPLDLAGAIGREAEPDRIVLVDCLTLWVTNLMMAEEDIDGAFGGLLAALEGAGGPVVLVSNEVGQGIVPDNAMARAFRDLAGILHQRVAGIADTVYFVIAGLPQKLKG